MASRGSIGILRKS